MRAISILFLLLVLPMAARADSTILSQWTGLGPGGTAETRAVVAGTQCPPGMTQRAAATHDFPLVCSQSFPPLAGNVRAAQGAQRILVLGDTGCRIKPPALQDCSDIAKWPFPEVAASAAKLKPDLVIHVGDYLYRESACPANFPGCAGTPWGDNWPSWNADFFAPAAPLLAAAPWVFVRGNHEDCQRAGAGYMRLLGPLAFDPAMPCADHLKAYAVQEGAMNLVVIDNASAPELSVVDSLVPGYQADFASLGTLGPAPQWLLMHRPIWGLIKGPLGIPVGGNLTMMAAVGDQSVLAPVALMLAGHIHTFEAINYAARVPPQIVAGNGGDNLDPTPLDLKGAQFQGLSGVKVKDGLSVGGFGFLLMTKKASDWLIDLYRADGSNEGECRFAAGRIDCNVAPGQK